MVATTSNLGSKRMHFQVFDKNYTQWHQHLVIIVTDFLLIVFPKTFQWTLDLILTENTHVEKT